MLQRALNIGYSRFLGERTLIAYENMRLVICFKNPGRLLYSHTGRNDAFKTLSNQFCVNEFMNMRFK